MNGDFIRKKIELAGFQLSEVARKMEISQQDLQSKLKSKDIKVSFMENVAKSINKSVYYFFETKDEKNLTNTDGKENGKENGNKPKVEKTLPSTIGTTFVNEPERKYIGFVSKNLIPLYDGVVTAGLRSVADLSPQIEPVEYVDAGDWFRDATAAMRVHDDSMYPEYKSGSIVALKEVKDKRLVVYGQDYVIETAEYRVIKRLQRSDDRECWLLASINTDVWEVGPLKGRMIHEPFDVHLDLAKRVFKVLGSVKRNESQIILGRN